MNKGLKITLISLGLVGTCVGVWYLFFKDKKGDETPDVKEKSKQEKKRHTTKNSNSYKSEGDPLKMYSDGKNVECLQRVLNVKGCKDKNGSALTPDGRFGPLTESSLTACGYGKSISLNALKELVQDELNKGNTVSCTGSCCAGLVAQNTNNTGGPLPGLGGGCDGDWDCDGMPDMIDKDAKPYNAIPYNTPYIPSLPGMAVDNTYVHTPSYAFEGGNNGFNN
tara:strand:+ start:507 stop:1175 length:669 start_codon:yes stop_codon:yes gene_type:complete